MQPPFTILMQRLASFCSNLEPDLLVKSIPIGEISPAPKKLRETQEHVILVIGESLGINNLSLYGYPKATTPRLKALKEKNCLQKNWFLVLFQVMQV